MGTMDSLWESGVLWSLLLKQDSQPLQWHLRLLMDVPAGAEFCWQDSENIPAVSVPPSPLCLMVSSVYPVMSHRDPPPGPQAWRLVGE